jgi:glycine/D-amino acid oxidase-like deaminating enzyme
VVAALWLPDEGRIQPLTLLAHLAERARACGVKLIGGARVASWEAERGVRSARWRIQLEDGRHVLARALGVAVGPTSAANARIYALAFAADLPVTFPLFWDAAPYIYSDFRPGNGRLTVSGGRYGRAGAMARDAHYHAALVSAARRWLPELARTMPSHAWAVDLEVAADMVPAVRKLEGGAPGAAIEGLGALGVLPGIVLGKRAGAELARALA